MEPLREAQDFADQCGLVVRMFLVGNNDMADEVTDAIRQNAQGTAKASGDTGSGEQHKLTDQIAADRFLASKEAAKSKSRGLKFNRFVPPGAE